MVGKVARALIRNEADAYRAQGLQEEALALFRRALSAPDLPAEVKASFEREIQEIEAEMAGMEVDEARQLSEEQIAVIRQGWSEDASTDELAVSAAALQALGRYGDALEEWCLAVRKGHALHRAVGPLAECLARLYAPADLVGGVHALFEDLHQGPGAAFPLALAIAEQMARAGHREHAAALGGHLSGHTGLSRSHRIRLEALRQHTPAAALPADGLAPPRPASLFQRIRSALARPFAARRA